MTSLRALALGLLLASPALWAGTPPAQSHAPVISAANFSQGVAQLEAHPMAEGTYQLRPALMAWLQTSQPGLVSHDLCQVQMPWITGAQWGDDVASVLFAQKGLEEAAYRIDHLQAAAPEYQAAALSGTLRMYLAMKALNPKVSNAFADAIVAEVKVKGMGVINAYTCAGSVSAPAVMAAPAAANTP